MYRVKKNILPFSFNQITQFKRHYLAFILISLYRKSHRFKRHTNATMVIATEHSRVGNESELVDRKNFPARVAYVMFDPANQFCLSYIIMHELKFHWFTTKTTPFMAFFPL